MALRQSRVPAASGAPERPPSAAVDLGLDDTPTIPPEHGLPPVVPPTRDRGEAVQTRAATAVDGDAGRRRPRRALRLTRVLVAVAALALLGAAAFYALPARAATAALHPLLRLVAAAPPLPESLAPDVHRTVLLAADGSEIAVLFDAEERSRTAAGDVPAMLRDALLAAEDERFYQHTGVDHRALLREALADLVPGGSRGGAATLTQQLVRDAFLPEALAAPVASLRRTAAEALYALELERRLPKDEILARYLDEAYFGEGVYGITAAAERYFAKTPAALDLAETALLVGILRAPGRLNPVDAPDAAMARRNAVLDVLAATGRASPSDVAAAKSQPLTLRPPSQPAGGSTLFVAYVEHSLLHDPRLDPVLGADRAERERLLSRGGVEVRTALDPRLQTLADAAVAAGGAQPAAARGLVAVEPGTGLVRALAAAPVTGASGDGGCADGATGCDPPPPLVPVSGSRGRPPGAVLRPLIGGAALAAGVPPGWQEELGGGPTAGCAEADIRSVVAGGAGDRRVVDLADGVRASDAAYAAALTGMLGPGRVLDFARSAGLRTARLPSSCALAAGAGSVHAVELATAYAALAGGGSVCRPSPLVEVRRLDAGAVLALEPQCDQAIARNVAATLVDLLQTDAGAGASLGRPSLSVGTAVNGGDGWFLGAVPQLAAAAWSAAAPGGHVAPDADGGAAALWAAYMRPAVEPLPVGAFPPAPPPPRVRVPNLVGMDADQLATARTTWRADHSLHLVERTVTDWRPPGSVVAQDPAPGADVAAGHRIVAVVSDGLGNAPALPDVVGSAEAEARRLLEAGGWRVRVERREERTAAVRHPEAAVVDMRPAAGTPYRPGQPVTLLVVHRRPLDAGGQQSEGADAPARPQAPAPSPESSAPAPDEAPPADAQEGEGRPVRIVRVVHDPAGDDLAYDGGERVVLQNVSDVMVDVAGWMLRTEAGDTLTVPGGYRLAPGARLAVHSGRGRDTAGRCFAGRTTEALANDGGEVGLFDASGAEQDRRAYE